MTSVARLNASALPISPDDTDDILEVCRIRYDVEHVRLVCFDTRASVGQIACLECSGTGWWAYAAYAMPPGPCVDCKGTGRVYVGLY